MKVDSYSKDELVCVNCKERAPLPRPPDQEDVQTTLFGENLGHDNQQQAGTMITNEDLQAMPQIKDFIGRETPYFQEAFDYAQEKYDEDCRRYASECPDRLRLEPELYYKQVYYWFICEKVLPSIGKTVLEDYVQAYVAPKDPEVAARMLQAGECIRGSFRILDSSHLPLMSVEHEETSKRYLALTRIDEPESRRLFTRGSVWRAKIHPWGEKYYIFEGILARKESDEGLARRLGLITPGMVEGMMTRMEDDWVKEHESVLVNTNTTLQSAMNKYPSQWVDAICSSLGINIKAVRLKKDKIREVISKLELNLEEAVKEKLEKGHIQALRMLMENGWIVKYGQLARRFSTDVGLYWNEHPPTSEIGVLRLHGLVVVGRMPEAGRLYKVAVVPIELRAPIKRFLSSVASPPQ